MIQYTLEQGVNPHQLSDDGTSPLMIAFKKNHLDMAKLLLQHGADMEAEVTRNSEEVWNVLAFATMYSGMGGVELLVKHDTESFQKMIHQGSPSPFLIAAWVGNEPVFKFLMRQSDEDPCNRRDRLAIYQRTLPAAVRSKKIEIVELLCSRKVDVNVRGRNGRLSSFTTVDEGIFFSNQPTALQAAIHARWPAMAALLLQKGANPNQKPESNSGDDDPLPRPLLGAAEADSAELLDLLLEYGAAVEGGEIAEDVAVALAYHGDVLLFVSFERRGFQMPVAASLLVLFAWHGLRHQVQQLIMRGGSIDATATLRLENLPRSESLKYLLSQKRLMEFQSVLTAALWSGNDELIEFVLAAGANVNNPTAQDHHHASPLTTTILCRRLDWARKLLDAGADPRDSRALEAAVEMRSMDTFHLIQHACLTSHSCPIGVYALAATTEAVLHNDIAWVRTLLATGVDINQSPYIDNGFYSPGISPLAAAVTLRSPEILRLLLCHGANPSRVFYHGIYGPALACLVIGRSEQEVFDIVKCLLDAGAQPNHSAKYSFTPLEAAIRTGSTTAIQLLIDAGADVNLPNSDNEIPLEQAVRDADTMIVQQLLDAGADIYATPSEPWQTIIELAIEKRRLDTLQLFLKIIAQHEHLFILQYSRVLRKAHTSGQSAMLRFLQAYRRKAFPNWRGETDEQILSDISNRKKDMKYLLNMGIRQLSRNELERAEWRFTAPYELWDPKERADWNYYAPFSQDNPEEETVLTQGSEMTQMEPIDLDEVLTDTEGDTCSETGEELREILDDTIWGLQDYF